MYHKHQNDDFNFDRATYALGNGISVTVPEIFILGALGIFIIIAMSLCLREFKRCAQNLLDGRRRKKRVLKYLTDGDITPAKGNKKDENVETPEKDIVKTI